MWQSYKRFCSDRGRDFEQAFTAKGWFRSGFGVFWSAALWFFGSILYLCFAVTLMFLRAVWWLLRVVIFFVKWSIAKLFGKPTPPFPRHVRSDVSHMTGEEFEQYVAQRLRSKGYSDVRFTPTTGDYGVDLTAIKGGVRYAFQCKRYAAPVGVKAVQEIYSGCHKYGAERAVVVTNSTYTPNAKTLADDLGVTLWDLEMLDAIL